MIAISTVVIAVFHFKLKDMEAQKDLMTHQFVVNHEEQYSIWPADRHLPLDWLEWENPANTP
jgi:uncharacterized protein YbdZ (MbtH family)